MLKHSSRWNDYLDKMTVKIGLFVTSGRYRTDASYSVSRSGGLLERLMGLWPEPRVEDDRSVRMEARRFGNVE